MLYPRKDCSWMASINSVSERHRAHLRNSAGDCRNSAGIQGRWSILQLSQYSIEELAIESMVLGLSAMRLTISSAVKENASGTTAAVAETVMTVVLLVACVVWVTPHCCAHWRNACRGRRPALLCPVDWRRDSNCENSAAVETCNAHIRTCKSS
jgi:hypothetical protein